ncbi:hypothetical protein GCM10023339_02970 [Alloalcanivorax gelatiniphagus]
MSFEVEPHRLERAGGDLESMAGAMPAVAAYLETHLTLPQGGTAFDLVRDKTEYVRTTLGDVYGATGSMTRYLTSAGSALVGTARDYREVDRDQWEHYDQLVTSTGERDEETSFYDTSTGGESLGVSRHDVTGMLREPTGTYMMEGWQAFQDGLNYCLDLSIVVDALLSVPLFQTFPSASDRLLGDYRGDWLEVARACDAMTVIAEVADRVANETTATSHHLFDGWSGRAAGLASDSLATFVHATWGHADDIRKYADGINNIVTSATAATDVLANAIDSIIPLALELNGLDPADLAREVFGGGGRIARMVSQILQYLSWAGVALDLLFTLFTSLGALTFGQMDRYRDLSLPIGDPVFRQSDVNGPMP